MKNTYILSMLMGLASVFSGFAQDAEPNRMLVVDGTGNYKSFVVGRLNEIRFARVEGDVSAYLQVENVTLTSLTVTTQMTDACRSYLINVVPGVQARQYAQNAMAAAAYLRSVNSPEYNENFNSGTMSGVELRPGTEYAVMTLGIDEYNTDGDVEVEYFTTPNATLAGNVDVTCSLVSADLNNITVKMTPTSDTKGYSYVIGERGTLAKQYEQFATMMGFANIGDMVRTWGGTETGKSPLTHTFKSLDPNTDYEIYIQAWDKNDNYAPMVIFNCSTQSKGGPGEAGVTVTLGDYKMTDWDGLQKPSQFITFTPNDQTSCYRFHVATASEYAKDEQGMKDYVTTDPDMPVAYWYFYDPLTTDFQINPGVDYVVLTAAKNVNKEWSPVKVDRFTTPAKVSSAPAYSAPAAEISTRINSEVLPQRPGYLPFLKKGGVTLSK